MMWDERQPTAAQRATSALRIALLYGLVAGLWIFLSDRVVHYLEAPAWMQTIKGWAFVVVTAGMLFVLIRRSLDRLHQSQQALIQSQDRFRRILETTDEGVWVIDPEMRALFLNARAAEMIGYRREDLLERSVIELIHPDDRATTWDQVAERRQGLKGQYDLRLRHKGGHWLWGLVTANPVYDEAGQFVGSLVMVTDITARKQAEQALRDSEERFRLLIEGAHDYCLYMIDPAGRIVSWNLGAQRLLGAREAEVLGRDYSRFFPPEEVARGEPALCLEHALEDGACDSQGWCLRADGARFWSHRVITALRTEGQDLRGYAMLVRDITQARQSELALRDSEERFRAVFHHAGMGIAIGDRDGRFLDANPAFMEMLGRTPDEVRGRPFAELTHPEDVAESMRQLRSLRDGTAAYRHMVKRLLRHDRESVWVRRTVSAVREPDGQVKYLVVLVEDITERRKAREEIERLNTGLELRVAERTRQLQEANREMEAFAATVGHEFRAPLQSIQTFATRLLHAHEHALDETGQEEARRIVGGAARMLGLIDDLLDYSRALRSQLKPQRISLSLVVHETLGRLERDFPECKPAIVVETGLPSVLGHRVALTHAVYNLLSNAVRHVAEGTQPQVRVWAEARGQTVRLWIQDNGVGIPAEQLERLFQPTAADTDGTGIGLHIAQRAVERMSGRLGGESTVGQGSRFWIELPGAA